MLTTLAGCGRTILGECSEGEEQCPCVEQSDCADGLVCASQVCVELPEMATDPPPTTDVDPTSCQSVLAMTAECVLGTEIASVEWGHARCRTELGEGWVWVDHHYQGGWSVNGTWIDDGQFERGWAHISDQDAECFSSAYGMTWYRRASGATCNDATGLEGPDFDPHDGIKCNAYSGDTPCEYCRPLICARCG